MARNLDPKCKQCRRVGEKLFLKGDRCFSPKCAMVKRNYPPGMHGPKGMPRLSEYGIQLKEKQKLLKIYRLLEKQFQNYFIKAKRIKGKTGEILMRFLELRLDNVVYRLGIAKSRDKSRQLVNHGHIQVNGKNVNIPSYQVKVNDTIQVKPSRLGKPLFLELNKSINVKDIPSWLTYLELNKLKAKVIKLPESNDTRENVNTAVIVEYYSR